MCYLRVSYVLLTVKISYFFILFEKVPENEEKPQKYWIFPGLSVFFFSLCNYLLLNSEALKQAIFKHFVCYVCVTNEHDLQPTDTLSFVEYTVIAP